MKSNRLFWIGLLITVSTFIFVGGIMFIQDISLNKSNYSFTVIFETVQGLNEGDDVTMLGKRIGKVSKARIIGQKISVELSIDNSFAFKIPIDSKIEVKSEGLMGSKYVSIDPGVDTKKFILAGETVEGTREYDFSEITPGIIPLTQDLGVFARRLKATLGEEEKDNIRETIGNVESLTHELDEFIKDYRDVISDEDQANFKSFIANLNEVSLSLKNASENDLAIIMENLKNISGGADDFREALTELKNTSSSFSDSAERLHELMSKIENKEGSLGKLLGDDALYDNLNGFAMDLRELIQDVKDNPTKYMKAYWRGKK